MAKYKLIATYPGSPEIGTIIVAQEDKDRWKSGFDFIEENNTSFKRLINGNLVWGYPTFWEKVVEKDYEILELFQLSSSKPMKLKPNGNYDGVAVGDCGAKWLIENNIAKINSVRRKSDGDIFNIGDKLVLDKWMEGRKYITIDEIYFNEHNQLSFRTSWNPAPKTFIFGLSDLNCKRFKEPLFISEDGVDVFKGDTTILVNKKFFTISSPSPQEEKPTNPDYLVFAKGNNAADWMGENAPRYSRKDLIEFANIMDDIKKLSESNVDLFKNADKYTKENKPQYSKKEVCEILRRFDKSINEYELDDYSSYVKK